MNRIFLKVASKLCEWGNEIVEESLIENHFEINNNFITINDRLFYKALIFVKRRESSTQRKRVAIAASYIPKCFYISL